MTNRSESEANAREAAMGEWVRAIAEGATQRAAAVPLLARYGLTYKALLGYAQRNEAWGQALEAALATKIGRLEGVLWGIATTAPGDISDDPQSAKVKGSTAMWLLQKWDPSTYVDRTEQKTTIVEPPKDDSAAAIVDDAVSLMSDEEKAELLRRLQG